jgi:hypothetical protein
MTMYLTKTWGFDAPCGPLQFSLNGWRENARKMLKPGDLVVIVGTTGDETAPDERGMILGLMEPTTIIVSSLDYALVSEPKDFDENGRYRWPFGLELRNAWQFSAPRTKLSSIIARNFHMDAALGIVPLEEAEAARIVALPREQVPLLRPIKAAARIEGDAVARRKAAPPPTTTRIGIMHMRRAPAYTYAMLIEGGPQPACKIGWAFDWKIRERQFNQSALPAIGGLKYRTVLHELWPTAQLAFQMEQDLLRQFDQRRHAQNNEVVVPLTKSELERSWIDTIIAARGRTRRA